MGEVIELNSFIYNYFTASSEVTQSISLVAEINNLTILDSQML